MTVFAGIAEFERDLIDLIRERTSAGREAARHRGTPFGRPRKLNLEQAKLARRPHRRGQIRRHIADTFNVHTATILSALSYDPLTAFGSVALQRRRLNSSLTNPTLLKALLSLVPVSLLLTGSVILFHRERKTLPLLQLIGASGLVLIVLTHVAEALHLFPFMGWGREHSFGHYLDLAGAGIGVTLFPIGYCFRFLRRMCLAWLSDR
jgi:hypothetical protein